MKRNRHKGFTLLEILIALFIFTMLSMMLAQALHTVIAIQEVTEKNAARLTELQMALLMMSRDLSQAVNRPTLDVGGKEEPAFEGSPMQFTFTHTGLANPNGEFLRSSLQRERYDWRNQGLWRTVWVSVDQAPRTLPDKRQMLKEVAELRFSYLDHNGKFHNDWPRHGDASEPLPQAVRIFITIPTWGKLTQLYVISTPQNKATPASQS